MKRERQNQWLRIGQGAFILGSLGWAMVACAPLTGLMGHMIMAVLDSAFGARLAPTAPWATWAIAGAILGAGPALWSWGPVRKRRSLVLWIPLLVIVAVGVISTLLIPTTG